MAKLTVKDIFDLKGQRQVTEVNVGTPAEAKACEVAGIDMIITGERSDLKAFRAAAPNTFLSVGFINTGNLTRLRFGGRTYIDFRNLPLTF